MIDINKTYKMRSQRFGKTAEMFAAIRAHVKIMQITGILPKNITQDTCEHSILLLKPQNKAECGICQKDIKLRTKAGQPDWEELLSL